MNVDGDNVTPIDDEAVREFLEESRENLDRLDQDFVKLEENPSDKNGIASVFRTIHTIKGTAGFLAFGKLETLAHAGEHVLARIRDGVMELTPETTTALLAMVDKVREILAAIQATGGEGDADPQACRERLLAIAEGKASSSTPTSATPVESESGDARPAQTTMVPTRGSDDRSSAQNASAAAASESTVRVHVALLDRLMNLVGELVLARNQIAQAGSVIEDTAFVGAAQRLSAVTSELQEGIMKTRMQPIGSIWDKLPRVVRDLAMVCNKHVRVELEGRDTELDRTIMEAIKDPLTHIVRNAVDHGIEKPEVRAAAGKPRTASLRLRAYHEGGQVNIEIADDGAGVDIDAVRVRAVERGLIDAERAAAASERELVALIFQPGFSTAKVVSNVSGRGVGMDVVKTNIERIGGAVELVSVPGRGTTVKLKIPLTLAIVPALVVSSAGERFAIPQASLLELVRGADGPNRVEWVHDAPVFRLRDEILPLVYLDATLDLAPRVERHAPRPAANIIVLKAESATFGLVVDEVRDTQEIVVKPLGKELKRLSVFAGATIMGDGQVALIVDVPALGRRLCTSNTEEASATPTTEAGLAQVQRQRFVVARAGRRGHVAVPLHMVWRLEEFDRAEVKTVGGRDVVVCRGEILRLIDLDGSDDASIGGNDSAKVAVIVHHLNGETIGVRVGRIVDIVDEPPGFEAEADLKSLTILDGEVAELIDISALAALHLTNARGAHP